jgi:hypothetical protein
MIFRNIVAGCQTAKDLLCIDLVREQCTGSDLFLQAD